MSPHQWPYGFWPGHSWCPVNMATFSTWNDDTAADRTQVTKQGAGVMMALSLLSQLKSLWQGMKGWLQADFLIGIRNTMHMKMWVATSRWASWPAQPDLDQRMGHAKHERWTRQVTSPGESRHSQGWLQLRGVGLIAAAEPSSQVVRLRTALQGYHGQLC